MSTGRSSGTTTDSFVPVELEAALVPLANKKVPDVDFEFERYEKTRKSQGPDRAGLVYYFPLLSILLDYCPKGLPKPSLLKIVWLSLNKTYGIMGEASKKLYRGNYDEWAEKTVEKLAVALRHVRDLAASQTSFVDPKLQTLMGKIDTTGLPLIAKPAAAPPAPNLRKSRVVIRAASNASEGSVEICGVTCMCEKCRVVPMVDLGTPSKKPSTSALDHDASDGDSIEREAEHLTEHVTAKRGGRKRELEEQEELVNTPAPLATPAAALPTPKSNAKVPKVSVKRRPSAASLKRPAARNGSEPKVNPVVEPIDIQIVCRDSPPERREAYLMLDRRYLCGCTGKRSENYKVMMNKIMDEIKNGSLSASKTAAVERFGELLAAG